MAAHPPSARASRARFRSAHRFPQKGVVGLPSMSTRLTARRGLPVVPGLSRSRFAACTDVLVAHIGNPQLPATIRKGRAKLACDGSQPVRSFALPKLILYLARNTLPASESW